MIFHSVIYFLYAEQPETRTGSGWQHERSFGFLVTDRCFASIRFFKNVEIKAKNTIGKQETPSAAQALNFF
jgi:hypothetical protein